MSTEVLRPVSNWPGAVLFWCPGCAESHVVTTLPPNAWQFNGDFQRPTFAPSILVTRSTLSEAAQQKCAEFKVEHGRYPTKEEVPADVHLRCHSYVRDGQIEFLGDCSHAMKNRTVPLAPFE